jgi:hypothetical protein
MFVAIILAASMLVGSFLLYVGDVMQEEELKGSVRVNIRKNLNLASDRAAANAALPQNAVDRPAADFKKGPTLV